MSRFAFPDQAYACGTAARRLPDAPPDSNELRRVVVERTGRLVALGIQVEVPLRDVGNLAVVGEAASQIGVKVVRDPLGAAAAVVRTIGHCFIFRADGDDRPKAVDTRLYRFPRPTLVSGLSLAALALASPAHADPCTAPVTGYRAGQTVTGQVRYVGDGDSICIGQAANPATWIEVRLADYFAPELNEPGGHEAKRTMDGIAYGRPAVCTVRRGQNGRTSSYDRVIASCSIGGVNVGEMMRRAGVSEGGRGR